jgi:transposase
MGKKRSISEDEKAKIVRMLAAKVQTADIAKRLKRDHRTIKKYVENINTERKKRSDAGKRKVTSREMRRLKVALAKSPLASSKTIFEQAGIDRACRKTRCNILNDIAKNTKPVSRPPLTKQHKAKRVKWATNYIKCDFSRVIFTDECRATLDGPDGFSRGWVGHGFETPFRVRRQQGGGGVMFWAGICGDTLIGPFMVEEGVKMNSEAYCDFLTQNFFKWYKSQTLSFKRKCIYMHDNAPSHASKYTTDFLASKGFKDAKLMVWPPASPDLNPIENLWSIVKRKLYEAGKQYNSKKELKEAIKASCRTISPETIKNLTTSMDGRLVKILESHGGYINM